MNSMGYHDHGRRGRVGGRLGFLAILLVALGARPTAYAADLSHGLMIAVPTPGGKGPKINGSLKGWDLSAAEPLWYSSVVARKMHALITLEYTRHALYLGVRVRLPHRHLRNPNNPLDAFWCGDEVELRVVADPAVTYPVNPNGPDVVSNPRVVHMTFWKDSANGKCYINLVSGVHFNLGHAVNPPGSAIAIGEHGRRGYTLTARIPWTALHVPGGTNPFTPGQRMTATTAVHWGFAHQALGLFRVDPGLFAFAHAEDWGQIEFSKTGHLVPRHPSLREYLKRLVAAPVGRPIIVKVPHAEKVSVNIFSAHGRVIRQLLCGRSEKKGPLTVYWNGRDQWGAPVPPGKYKWGAYFSPGLKIKYVGTACNSGTPPYPTVDGRGGWGGDHGPCVDVAADPSGMYFLWDGSEAGRALIKVGYSGKTLWRRTPFVNGGYGGLLAMATNGRDVFVIADGPNPQLLRLNASTGTFLAWPDGSGLVSISHGHRPTVPKDSSPLGYQPECTGIAANAHEVFCPVYSRNQIRILSTIDGHRMGTLHCPGPRGVCLDDQGNLFAVSYVVGKPGEVVEFIHARGSGHVVVQAHLAMPWHVAVDSHGHIHVTDEGTSQQVKVFSPAGKILQTLGRRGGRPWAGKYIASDYLNPAGIAADFHRGILTAQAALPKVMSRNSATTGQVLQQWFGGLGYSGVVSPDPQNPREMYCQFEPAGFARTILSHHELTGKPEAYWLMPQAGYHAVGTLGDLIAQTEVVLADNQRKYFVCDANPHGICLIKGNQMLPVAHFLVKDIYQRHRGAHCNVLEIWSDANGDHHIQPGEVQRVTSIAGQPLPSLAESTGSMWMDHNGDVYLVTGANSIIEIPARRFLANGDITWDMAKARYVVPWVLPRAGRGLYTGWRQGILGVRVDSRGNIYTCFDATVPYSTDALTTAMHQGMSHDADCNTAKFAKYAPNGRLLWMAGRKAAGTYWPGALHHFWVLAGLVGDNYVAGVSEWGRIYFYTHDGFYADALMNEPALAPPPGPYSMGSETFSGLVKYYPRLNQVWAYEEGNAYRILGFDHGVIKGESREWGTVRLNKIYPITLAPVQAAGQVPLVIARVKGLGHSPQLWQRVPVRRIDRNGKPLAHAQLAWGKQYLYARFQVQSTHVPRNSADVDRLIFHGGDSVGLDLGPARKQGKASVAGDVRILAGMVRRKIHLVAFMPISRQLKRPANYKTPAGGEVHFAFVGDVPGGRVHLEELPKGHGYTVVLAVPLSFLQVPLHSGASIAADVEINRSGFTDRGLQTVSRTYLFSPENSVTTMIDDMPTEARLNPQWWGTADVK